MYDNKTDAKVTGGMLDSKSSTPINPMTFMSEEQVSEKDKKFEKFKKALRFGCPDLCDRLMAIYEKEGLEGLNKLNKIFINLHYINRIIEGSLEVDFEGCNTKEEAIVALLTGEVDIDWEGIYDGNDGWVDTSKTNL